MTPADEAFLTELHQNLEKRAIGPDDPRYVALERQRSGNGRRSWRHDSRRSRPRT